MIKTTPKRCRDIDGIELCEVCKNKWLDQNLCSIEYFYNMLSGYLKRGTTIQEILLRFLKYKDYYYGEEDKTIHLRKTIELYCPEHLETFDKLMMLI